MSAPVINLPANPAIADDILEKANIKLRQQLSFISNAYGKAQDLERLDSKNRRIKYPAIFAGGTNTDNYYSLLPNADLGCFTWWHLGDYKVEKPQPDIQIIKADFGLVFWGNLNNILNPEEYRNLEEVKQYFIEYFESLRVVNARFELQSITERSAEIYKGYTIKETEQQYLMHPYAGLRLNGKLTIEKICR